MVAACTPRSPAGAGAEPWCKLAAVESGYEFMSAHNPPRTPRARMPLHWKMAIGFVAGLLLGMVVHYGVGADAAWVQWLTTYVTQPFATLFLRLIFMLVIPLLFSALVVGVVGDGRHPRARPHRLEDAGLHGRAVRRSRWCSAWCWSTCSSPAPASTRRWRSSCSTRGRRARAGHRQRQRRRSRKGLDMLLSIVPDNVVGAASSNSTILAVMFFALMFGIGLVLTPTTPATDTLKRGIEGLFEVSMTLIGLVIRLAPYAVFCFMFNLAALFGWDLLVQLGAYVGVVVLALAIHMFVVYSLALKFVGG